MLKRDFKQKREANWEEQPNRAQNWGELELKNPDFEEYYKAQACCLDHVQHTHDFRGYFPSLLATNLSHHSLEG